MEHQVRSRAREGAWQEAGGAVQQYHVANGSLTELVGRHVVGDLQRGTARRRSGTRTAKSRQRLTGQLASLQQLVTGALATGSPCAGPKRGCEVAAGGHVVFARARAAHR